MSTSPAVRVTRAPYSPGAAGHQQSLELIGAKIREGRIDPAVSGWAGDVLLAAGLNGRNHSDIIRQQAQALLDAYRKQTVYTPDAHKTEVIQGAAATLCLRPGLCIRKGDCDDGVTALGAALLSIGIPTAVVKEDYPGGEQSHVLLACKDENSEWFLVDPSTNHPIGVSYAPPGTQRTYVDPMKDAPIEIVGIGKPAIAWLPEWSGLGSVTPIPDPNPPPPPTIPGTWTDAGRTVNGGLRYAVAISVPDGWQIADVNGFLASDWLIESTDQRTELTNINAWIMIGLARHDATLNDSTDVAYAAVLQEVPPPPAQPAPPIQPGTTNVPSASPADTGVGIGTVLVAAFGVAVIGGVAWGYYEKQGKRKKLANPVRRRRLSR